jgi:Flp pilus assembly pilin Flp
MKVFAKLWKDDCGALLTFEWILLATILVLALVTGLKTVQQSVLNELEDVSNAVGSVSQTYVIGGTRGCCGTTNGSEFRDRANRYDVNTCFRSFDRGANVCER